MRKLGILVWLASIAMPLFAMKSVTVAQLALTLAQDEGMPDADVAQQLSALELTERLSAATLSRLRADLPGENSQQQLTILADRSAFLTLPTSEIPATPAPDVATQRKVMALVVNYVTKTTNQLPNFLAKRDTSSFEDRPQSNYYSAKPLQFVSRSSASVLYRDGQEVVDPTAVKGQKKTPAVQGLTSWGEFGPILNTVLLDAAQSKLAWSHWEQGTGGPLMVFGLAVLARKSHYQVQYCCVSDDPQGIFHKLAGYHGEIAVDPASGAVLRVALEAELTPGDPLTAAAIMVEYGPVDIAGKSVILPLRSVALSQRRIEEQVVAGARPAAAFDQSPIETLLNEVSFEQYHRLGSEMRIVADLGASARDRQPDTAPGDHEPSSTEAPFPAAALDKPSPAGTEASAPSPIAGEAASTAAPAGTPSPPQPAAPVEPEIDVTASSGIPDAPAHQPAPGDSGFVLKMTSRLVDVGLVVVDKKGHAVKGLKPGAFELYDNGRKQEIKFFNEFAASNPAAGSPAPNPGSNKTFSNASGASANSAIGAPPPEANTTILLFDESHIAWADMSNARQQALKFLNALDPAERVGFYTISSRGFRVLVEVTTDHAALIARLKKWMPTAASVANSQQDEVRNRQHFDKVQHASDLAAVNGSNDDVPDSSSPVDPQLMNMGSNPGRSSLVILLQVARHLSAIAGHKSLVWIASDNVFVNWNDLNLGVTDKTVNNIDAYALHSEEAMNDAHTAVYPLDVSQLEPATGGASADLANRNIEVNPASATGGAPNDLTPGRLKAEMLQDIRPIQGPIRELATATGGRALRRAADLTAELGAIVEDGRATYQLSFYPDTPADDQYHAVHVKIADRKGLTLRGRTGYFYAKEPTTLKERFRQAIWLPKDVSEIGVAATVDQDSSGASLQINVAASDLGLQEQAGRWMGKLDIFFVQRDQAGLHAQLEGQTLGLRLLPSSYQSMLADGIPFERHLQLKEGTDSLRVLVVDEDNGRMGSVTVPASAFTNKP